MCFPPCQVWVLFVNDSILSSSKVGWELLLQLVYGGILSKRNMAQLLHTFSANVQAECLFGAKHSNCLEHLHDRIGITVLVVHTLAEVADCIGGVAS